MDNLFVHPFLLKYDQLICQACKCRWNGHTGKAWRCGLQRTWPPSSKVLLLHLRESLRHFLCFIQRRNQHFHKELWAEWWSSDKLGLFTFKWIEHRFLSAFAFRRWHFQLSPYAWVHYLQIAIFSYDNGCNWYTACKVSVFELLDFNIDKR